MLSEVYPESRTSRDGLHGHKERNRSQRSTNDASTTRLQYVCIKQSFGEDAPDIHCPLCGSPTIEQNGEEEPVIKGCGHLACIYVDLGDDFEFRSKDFKRRMEAARIDEIDTSLRPIIRA